MDFYSGKADSYGLVVFNLPLSHVAGVVKFHHRYTEDVGDGPKGRGSQVLILLSLNTMHDMYAHHSAINF